MYRPRKGRGMRGLGASQVVTDPTTGQQYVMPISTTEVDVSTSGPAQYYDITGGARTYLGSGSTGGGSISDWLNQNSTTVLIGAGIFLGSMLLMGARR